MTAPHRPTKAASRRGAKAPAEMKLAPLLKTVRAAGRLFYSQLDGYLASEKAFGRRLDALIDGLGDLPLESDQGEEEVICGSTVSGDSLRGYLRQIASAKRLDKAGEGRMAKRLEFARQRFQVSVRESRIHSERLREVLGVEYSRSYENDLEFEAGDRRGPSKDHRDRVRARASELNRLRADFVQRNLSLVVDIALCYRTYGLPVMDLVQEGNSALIRAVEKFDWRKDVRFQTYATFWVRQAVERSIAFNKGIVRVPNYLQQKMRRLRREGVLPKRDRDVSVREVSEAFEVKPEVAGHLLQTERAHFSLDVSIDEGGETFASLLPDEHDDNGGFPMEFQLLRERLEEVLDTLSDLERDILEMRFGLHGCSPMTLEEVGQRMNVSRERIRQLQVRAIRKLQRPGLIQRLTGFV